VLLHRRKVQVAERAPLGKGRFGLRGRRGVGSLAALVAQQPAEGGKEANLGTLEQVVHQCEELGPFQNLL
jgi:hypothetical protein